MRLAILLEASLRVIRSRPRKTSLVAGFQGELADVTHAETGHHLAGDRGHLLDVAAGAGGHLGMAEHHILGGPSAQGTHDAGTQLGPAHQHLLLIGENQVRPWA